MFKIDLEFITVGSMAACLVTGAFLDHRQAANQDLKKAKPLEVLVEPSQELPINGPIVCDDLSEQTDLAFSVVAVGEVSRRGDRERVADIAAEVA